MKNPFKKETKIRYSITGYDITHTDGTKDKVRLDAPVYTDNVEVFRSEKKKEFKAVSVMLYFVDLCIN